MFAGGVSKLKSVLCSDRLTKNCKAEFEKVASHILSAIRSMSGQALEGEVAEIVRAMVDIVGGMAREHHKIMAEIDNDFVLQVQASLTALGELRLRLGSSAPTEGGDEGIAAVGGGTHPRRLPSKRCGPIGGTRAAGFQHDARGHPTMARLR